jgi:hypothetical protein
MEEVNGINEQFKINYSGFFKVKVAVKVVAPVDLALILVSLNRQSQKIQSQRSQDGIIKLLLV